MRIKVLFFILFLTIFCLTIKSQNDSLIFRADTVELYYDIGIYKLDKNNYKKVQDKLNTLNKRLNYQVEIISSSDYLGSKVSNKELSIKRATTIKKFLELKENIAIKSISYEAIGEISSKRKYTKGVKEHRKTTLIFKDETQVILEQIKTAKKGTVFVLRNLIFKPGRHYLRTESIPILKNLLLVMQENPNLEIEINGHICCGKSKLDIEDGLDIDTQKNELSLNRAKQIFKYLYLKKIDESRVSYKGLGFQEPLYYPEKTILDRKLNRRVEIKIINN